MALTYDTFRGVNVLVADAEQQDPGIAQLIQELNFTGIHGTRTLHHGKRARRFAVTGFAEAVSLDAMQAAVNTIQQMLELEGTYVHYIGGTSVTYLYCTLENYFPLGKVTYGIGTGYPSRNAIIVLTQNWW